MGFTLIGVIFSREGSCSDGTVDFRLQGHCKISLNRRIQRCDPEHREKFTAPELTPDEGVSVGRGNASESAISSRRASSLNAEFRPRTTWLFTTIFATTNVDTELYEVFFEKSTFRPADAKPYLPSASADTPSDSISDSCVVMISAVAFASCPDCRTGSSKSSAVPMARPLSLLNPMPMSSPL